MQTNLILLEYEINHFVVEQLIIIEPCKSDSVIETLGD